MLEVTYEIKKGDLIEVVLRRFVTRKSSLLIFAGFAVVLILRLFSPLPDSPLRFLAAITAFLLLYPVVIGGVLGFSLLTIWMRHNRETDKGFLTEHRMVFSEAGYLEETSVNRTESKWEGVFALKKDKKFIYVFESPDRMHLIPRRAFNSDHEFDDFFWKIETLKATREQGQVTGSFAEMR